MNNDQHDPIFASSLRELKWILVAWLAYFMWVMGYCGLFGYEVDPADLKIVMGMPSWVFWGIVMPWIAATGFTAWFSMIKMEDHPLPDSDVRPDSGTEIGSTIDSESHDG